MIMALDKFKFLYEFDDHNNEDDDNEGIKQMTVNKGEAIAFTNKCFHAGGQTAPINFSTICLRTLSAIYPISQQERSSHGMRVI